MTYQEVLAKRQKALDVDIAARKARDDEQASLPEVQDLICDPDNVVIHCSEASAELPGFVICHRPGPAQVARFKQLMWKDSKDKGVIEAKAKAGEDLVRQCLKWPPAEQYAAMTNKYGMLPDRVAKFLYEASEAAADEAGKG
jgi:hypothetical protein